MVSHWQVPETYAGLVLDLDVAESVAEIGVVGHWQKL
jgi:hypothetical protein